MKVDMGEPTPPRQISPEPIPQPTIQQHTVQQPDVQQQPAVVSTKLCRHDSTPYVVWVAAACSHVW